MIWQIAQFILMGFLGGVAYILVWKIKDRYEIARHSIVGGIVGFLYYYLYSQKGFPDLIMAFVSGYFGIDFIEGLIERRRAK